MHLDKEEAEVGEVGDMECRRGPHPFLERRFARHHGLIRCTCAMREMVSRIFDGSFIFSHAVEYSGLSADVLVTMACQHA